MAMLRPKARLVLRLCCCYAATVYTCCCLQKRVDIMGAEVGYFHHSHKGVDWVFVDHPSYPRPGGLYADEHGVYGDNQVSATPAAVGGGLGWQQGGGGGASVAAVGSAGGSSEGARVAVGARNRMRGLSAC